MPHRCARSVEVGARRAVALGSRRSRRRRGRRRRRDACVHVDGARARTEADVVVRRADREQGRPVRGPAGGRHAVAELVRRRVAVDAQYERPVGARVHTRAPRVHARVVVAISADCEVRHTVAVEVAEPRRGHAEEVVRRVALERVQHGSVRARVDAHQPDRVHVPVGPRRPGEEVGSPVAVHVADAGDDAAEALVARRAVHAQEQAAVRAGEHRRTPRGRERTVAPIADQDVGPAVAVDVARSGDRAAEAARERRADPHVQDFAGGAGERDRVPARFECNGVGLRTDHDVGCAVPVEVADAADRAPEPRALGCSDVLEEQAAVAPGEDVDGARVEAVRILARRADDQVGVPVAVHVARAADRATEPIAVGHAGEVVEQRPTRAGVHPRMAGPRPLPVADDHIAEAVAVDVTRRSDRMSQPSPGRIAHERVEEVPQLPIRARATHRHRPDGERQASRTQHAPVPRKFAPRCRPRLRRSVQRTGATAAILTHCTRLSRPIAR